MSWLGKKDSISRKMDMVPVPTFDMYAMGLYDDLESYEKSEEFYYCDWVYAPNMSKPMILNVYNKDGQRIKGPGSKLLEFVERAIEENEYRSQDDQEEKFIEPEKPITKPVKETEWK